MFHFSPYVRNGPGVNKKNAVEKIVVATSLMSSTIHSENIQLLNYIIYRGGSRNFHQGGQSPTEKKLSQYFLFQIIGGPISNYNLHRFS